MDRCTYLVDPKIRKRLINYRINLTTLYEIGKLEACEFEDTGKRLLSNFYSSDGSLVTLKESSEKIILCNGYDDTKCESFDGDGTVAIAETKVQHKFACMSINEQGRPTIMAGYQSSSVEILETRLT